MAVGARSSLLQLPAGRLFALAVGPWVAGVLVSGIAFGLPLATGALPRDLTVALALTAATLRAVGRIVAVVWLVRVATGLPAVSDPRLRVDNATNLSIASGFLAAYSLAACVLPVCVAWDLPGASAARYFAANGLQFGIFALASYVLLAYKAVVRLESAEGDYARGQLRRWGDLLGFLAFVIGVWWLQPRVRAAASRETAVPIEDHLVA